MRLLLDQDVYAVTARLLMNLGHDVLLARDIGYSRAPDVDLLRMAQRERRIFVTRDRDFGRLVFISELSTGVIYLRVPPAALVAGRATLQQVLTSHPESDLLNAFVVVEPGRYRLRRVSV